jgi:hypothetical protein
VQSADEYIMKITDYKIVLNGNEKKFVNPIVNINGNTYIAIREIAEALDYNVIWNQEEQSVNLVYKDTELVKYRDNEKYGYMDEYGNIVCKAQFDFAGDFINGIARVGISDNNASSKDNSMLYGFINCKGQFIVPVKYLYAWDFNEELALVMDEDGSMYYINEHGNRAEQKIIGPKFFTNGVAPQVIGGDSTSFISKPEELWSYVNSSGERVTDKKFEYAGEFDDGVAVVKSSGKYGIIDINFNTVINYLYDDLYKIDQKMFAAKLGQKWGIIDINNNIIADFNFFDIGMFSNGYAPVRKEQNVGAYMDYNGNIVMDSKFGMVYSFTNGVACVSDKDTGMYGVIDVLGEYIIEPKYYSLRQIGKKVFEVRDKSGGPYYYINLKDEKIIPR